MFSEIFSEIIKKAARIGQSPVPSTTKMRDLLEKCIKGNVLDDDEIVELMNGTRGKRNKKLILDYAVNYSRPHHKEILLLSPLYFSSICENKCSYCNFSIEGARLSLDEFLEEIDYLLELGYSSVELVSSQDTELFMHSKSFDLAWQSFDIYEAVKYFKQARKRLDKKGGGMLISNIPPLDTISFKRLKKTGLDCYLSWMETFNPSQYLKLHRKHSPKSNQAFRMNAYERAIEADIEHVAGGFLKGLFDWRQDEVILYIMDKYLKRKSGRGFSIIGTPRIKGSFINSDLVKAYQVSDEDYELNIALDKILFDGILWMQTREPFSLNYQLITRYGADAILTLSCSTAPGGYKIPPRARVQFPFYSQSMNESVKKLEDAGYTVHFKWNRKTLTEFQRKNSE